MKLLLDHNLSHKLCTTLADVFPGSSHVRLLGMATAADTKIWHFAGENGFIVVSLDSDFADLSVLRGQPPKVIWLRCGNTPTAQVEKLLRRWRADILVFASNPAAACLEIG